MRRSRKKGETTWPSNSVTPPLKPRFCSAICRSWWTFGLLGVGRAGPWGRSSTNSHNEYAGQVKVAKMNVDENPSTPSKYGIRAIPTLILFKGGEVVEQITGAVSKSSIKEMISQKAL